jgi:50S ribosomal protein L16 3-hydroxylase
LLHVPRIRPHVNAIMSNNDHPAGAPQTPLEWMFNGDRQLFADEHYLKRPFAKPGLCATVRSWANMTLVGELLRCSDADVIAGRQGQVLGDPIRNITDVQRALAIGNTVGLRHVQRYHPPLAGLAKEFETAFGGTVDIHLYCTPAGQPGFGWHYDAEEVFVLQTLGSKTWKLRKNTVNPWPLMENIPLNQRYEREISPVISCRLEAGDWLYVPSGYWHATQAHDVSISLSVGIRPPTAIDLLDALRGRLMASMMWRQRLPMNGEFARQTSAQRVADLTELCRQLGDDLADRFKSGFLAKQFSIEPAADVSLDAPPKE